MKTSYCMGLVKILLAILLIIVSFALAGLYLLPFNNISFSASNNYNFSVDNGVSQMQFYPNMRFANTEISYRIDNCPLQKQNDMENAFTTIESLTPLRFFPVSSKEQIYVTCDDKIVTTGDGMFIAGEGGPKNITVAGKFHVITSGEILLIKESNCAKPNIAIHELMHVLGFEHSSNPGNIMYNITKCSQVLGDDMIQFINEIYSIPSFPDLVFENVSSVMHGRFLDVNMTIRNAGLGDAGNAVVKIYADDNLVREVNLEPLEIGNGRFIYLGNIWVTQLSVSEVRLIIDSDFNEISKTNNEIKLE